MGAVLLLLLLLLAVHVSVAPNTKGDVCLNPDPSTTTCLLPQDEQHGIPLESDSDTPEVIPSGAQVITSYTFSCCGRIKTWKMLVHPGRRGDDGEYSVTFQVWRLAGNSAGGSGAGDSGQCSGSGHLVGENRFTTINLESKGLICETPDQGDEIWVEPGDVVGFYVVHKDGGARGVVLAESHTNESIWYGVDVQESGDPQCVYSVGFEEDRQLRDFTNHAPMLQVIVEPEECPQPTIKEAILPITNAATTTVTTYSFTTKTIPTDGNSTSNSQEDLSEAVMTTSGTFAMDSTEKMQTPAVDSFRKEYLLGTPIMAVTIVILVITIIAIVIYWRIKIKQQAHKNKEPVPQSGMESLNYNETMETIPSNYNIGLKSIHDFPNLSQSSNLNSLGYMNSEFPSSLHAPCLHGDSQLSHRESYVNMGTTPDQGYVTIDQVQESGGVAASTRLITPYAISAPKELDVGAQLPGSLIPSAVGNKLVTNVVVPYAVQTLALTDSTAHVRNTATITGQEKPAEPSETTPELETNETTPELETDETTPEQSDKTTPEQSDESSTSGIDLVHNDAYKLTDIK